MQSKLQVYRQAIYGRPWISWLSGRYTERISTGVRRVLVEPLVGDGGVLMRVTPFATFSATVTKRNGLESQVRDLAELSLLQGARENESP